MNQMLAYMIKFWLVAIPVSVIFVMSFLIAYLLSFVCFPISSIGIKTYINLGKDKQKYLVV